MNIPVILNGKEIFQITRERLEGKKEGSVFQTRYRITGFETEDGRSGIVTKVFVEERSHLEITRSAITSTLRVLGIRG